jgi:hypothetical protein
MRPLSRLPFAAAALACAAAVQAQEQAAVAAKEAPRPAIEWSGELRAHLDPRSANGSGLLAEADRLSPGIAPAQRSGATLEAGVRGHGHGLSADLLLRAQRFEGGGHDDTARFNELYASGDVPGAPSWQFSAGKKIVGWDVGYGWRPNDVVEQEERRTLLSTTPEGRPLLQLEHFGAETAWSLVWANPTHLNTRRLGAEESAFALRYYRRDGAIDWHGFARFGEHTHGSVGAAAAWVATESLELHGSWRFTQHADGWAMAAGADSSAVVTANPWQAARQGAASQWLVGLSWTNADQLSVLAEAWHDGTALADSSWDAWNTRTRALSAASALPGLPAPALAGIAGNLAWQATPWSAANLRRDNVFVRLSWQHDAWQPALDLLYTPADAGRVVTASLAWQGDRLRLEGGWRRYGGPSSALLAQLPLRAMGYLSGTWTF